MAVLLLVEGRQDFHAIQKLCQKTQIGSCREFGDRSASNADFDVLVKGSVERLLAGIPEELGQSVFDRIGVILDFDHGKNRWQSVCGRLREWEDRGTRAFDRIQPEPNEHGTLLTSKSGRLVGIWIWPDNKNPGDIEKFAGTLVPEGDLHWAVAVKVVNELDEPKFRTNHKNKAILHTWLAWQDPPGQQIGDAIRSETLRADSPAAKIFMNWLQRLKDETL